MARISNFVRSFDSGDRHESLAGIVALFGRGHNDSPIRNSISQNQAPKQIASWREM
jgi:hypothetical protein